MMNTTSKTLARLGVHGLAAAAALLTLPALAQRPDMTINSMATRDQNYELNNRASTEGKLRPEVAIPLQDAQRMMSNMEPVGAAEKIAKAEKVEGKSAYELHVIARLKSKLAQVKGDPDEAGKQYLLAAEGTWFTPADRAKELELIASLYYHKKDYAKAGIWFDRYAEAGGTNANTGMLRAQSHYLVDDYKTTAKVLDTELGRTMATAAKPPELMLKLLVDSKERIADVEGSKKAQQLLAQYYPANK